MQDQLEPFEKVFEEAVFTLVLKHVMWNRWHCMKLKHWQMDVECHKLKTRFFHEATN